ncbi:MAG: ABC transporter permease [Bacteroidota bacterium]|jgi:peptide/nickel transport system permease protein
MLRRKKQPSGKAEQEFNFRTHAWKQFRKNKPALWSLRIMVLFVLIAVLAPVIANEKPLYMRIGGETFWPAFTTKTNYTLTDPQTGAVKSIELELTDWKRMEFEAVVWAPIAWSPGRTDDVNMRYVGPSDDQRFIDSKGDTLYMPGRFSHILGTNSLGEDIAAGLIHGSRVSLSIGLLSMGIAAILGLLLGSLAGYFGNEKLKTTRARLWLTIFAIFPAWFYAFSVRNIVLRDALNESGSSFLMQLLISIFVFAFIIFIFNRIGKIIGRGAFLGKQVKVPVDSYISRFIEILNSIPTLILIISLSALAKEPSIIYVMVIIGLTSWTGIARFTRAEFMKIRGMDYIQAAQSMGFSEKRIMLRHALINGMAPSLVSIAFGIANAIIAESSLSFLGIGVPPDMVTWGKLLAQGKEYYQAWWLVVFPGIAIFITVTSYNLIGDGLRDAFDPKLKR